MVHIQGPAVLVLMDSTVVADKLAIILSCILDKIRQLHSPDGVGSVADIADLFLYFPVIDWHVGA